MRSSNGILHKQKSYLYSVFENNPDGIAILDIDFNIIKTNKAFKEFFKLKNDPSVIPTYLDFIPESDHESFRLQCAIALNKGDDGFSFHQLHKLGRKDSFVSKLFVSAISDESEPDICYVITVFRSTDIAVSDFSTENALFLNKSIADTMEDRIGLVDLSAQRLLYNNFDNNYYGHELTPDTNVNRFFLSIIHPEDYFMVVQEFIERMNRSQVKDVVELEFRIREKDGKWRWINERVQAFKSSDGNVTTAMFIHRDITAMKSSEKARVKTETLYKGLFEVDEVGIYITDPELKFINLNPTLCQMLGYDEAELKELSLTDLIPSDLIDRHFKNKLNITSGEVGRIHIEEVLLRKDGTRFIGLSSIKRLEDRNGQFNGVLVAMVDISQLKLAQKELDRRETFIESVNDTIPDILYIFDLASEEVVYSNRSLIGYLGYGEDSGKDIFEIIHPLDEKLVHNQRELIQIATNEEFFEMEFRLKDSTGAYLWFNCRQKVYERNDDDTVKQYISLCQDITERKLAELTLVENEEMFRSLFEQSPIPIGFSGEDGEIFKVNKHFCDFLGYEESELIGEYYRNITHSDDVDEELRLIPIQIENGINNPIEYEKRFITKDKKVVWASMSVSIIHDSENEVKYLISMAKDINSQKLAEEKMQRLHHERKIILEHMPAMFFFKDNKNNVIRCNEFAAFSLGKSAAEVEGKNVKELLPAFSDKLYADDQKVIATGEPILGIVEAFETPKGPRWLKTDKIPFFSEAGKAVGVFVYATDITDLKNVQDALKEKNFQMQEYIDSNMLLENFAHIASHDLKEPVRTICNFAQLLEKKFNGILDPGGKEYLGFIISGARNLDLLVNDLLTYSMVRSEKEHPTPTNLEKLLHLVQRNLDDIIIKSNATIEVINLPQSVRANKTKLTQVFQNLIYNALKFQKPTVDPIVKIEAIDRGEEWIFSVSDNGIGISKDHFNRIFLLFKKLHNKEQYEGTGIGLALCKKIIEQHNGRIWVESVQGEGTTFSFTLPKNQPDKI